MQITWSPVWKNTPDGGQSVESCLTLFQACLSLTGLFGKLPVGTELVVLLSPFIKILPEVEQSCRELWFTGKSNKITAAKCNNTSATKTKHFPFPSYGWINIQQTRVQLNCQLTHQGRQKLLNSLWHQAINWIALHCHHQQQLRLPDKGMPLGLRLIFNLTEHITCDLAV